MRAGAMAEMLAHHRKAAAFAALLTTFAGFALLIDRPKDPIVGWLPLPLLVAGGGLFTWAVWPQPKSYVETGPSLARQLLRRLTFDGRIVPLFPAFGVGIVLADLGYNILLSATPALQTEDTIVLLAAASFLGYGFVPPKFTRERDFVFLFFLILNAILVLPLLAARAFYADFEKSVDVYSWVALAPETSAILRLLGVSNTVHAVGGATAPGLSFTPLHLGVQVTVVITTACSGIYSFGIFASAFIAFVLTESRMLTRGVWLLMALGMLTAYVANILRMVVIVLVGYYTDTAETDLQNMLLAHSIFGWLIFLGWITLFWGVLFWSWTRRDAALGPGAVRRTAVSRCNVCTRPLTPMVAATRCECGKYYHLVCLARIASCSACGREATAKARGLMGGDENSATAR